MKEKVRRGELYHLYEGKKITSYSLGAEAEGKAEYPSTSIASYITYPCNYCLDPFYLVDPYTQRSGGAIQREIAKHKNTGEVRAVLQTFGICVACFQNIMRRQIHEH